MSFLVPPRKDGPRNQAFAESFWNELSAFARSRSGPSVTMITSMEVMAVLGCVRVLSEDVAQVPAKVFQKRSDGGSDQVTSHSLVTMLDVGPNDWQTGYDFVENMVIQTALGGNFYSFQNRVRGELQEIIPFLPGTVEEDWTDAYKPVYKVQAKSGEMREMPASAIWHLRGPSLNTRTGMAAIRQAREAIGLAIATEDAHASLHRNGGQTSGLYSVEGTLDAKQHDQLAKWVKERITGDARSSPLILDRQAKFTPNSMTGVDAEHLQTRRFQIEEICRAFRVMPIMIGQSDKAATYASAEQMFIAHVRNTLMPWFRRIEKSIDKYLLTQQDRAKGIYVKFLPNALMRGTAKDRAEFYKKMWEMGVYNPNEIRAFEEENPYKGGDTYRIPLNTADASIEADPPAEPSPQE